MKKLLPFLFLVSAPAYADMNHSISSSVKFESLSAASTADKIGSSYSISGNNVTTVDSNSAATIGGFGSTTSGVPSISFPSATQATSGEAFSFVLRMPILPILPSLILLATMYWLKKEETYSAM